MIINNFNINIFDNNKTCPFCFGTGKLKALQNMAIYNGGSIRGKDKQIKCKYCNGTGRCINES